MEPIVICRYAPHEGPGYFATYLTRAGLPWRLVKLDESERLPAADAISGLGMMGGPMSVNDDLPWIAPMCDLVRECVSADVPVIGHCLGGQLLAKSFGAQVTRNAVKEIGWGRIEVIDARGWGPHESFLSYHWHGETFAIPRDAVRIWSSAHCENQAFVLGKHFGMQCHVEMTEELIESWCETGAGEIERNLARSPAVQTPAAMRENVAQKLDALHRAADAVYDKWLEGLAK